MRSEVYLVPQNAGSLGSYVRSSLVVRYDTRAAFKDKGAYQTYDVTPAGTSPLSFYGAVFDGKYVHFAPRDGVAVRFDAREPPMTPPPRAGSFL